MTFLLNISPLNIIRNIWRLLIFTTTITGLNILLLKNDYEGKTIKKILINQQGKLNLSRIINKREWQSIPSMLGIDQREVQQKLLANLPIERIRVNQLIQPSRLQIKLVSRKAVAWAERHSFNGIEQGLVDMNGQWINMSSIKSWENKEIETRIVGWQSIHCNSISEILTYTSQISCFLKEIHIDPDGTFWLILVGLGPLHFGLIDDHLSIRISILKKLTYDLPNKLSGRRAEFIDISSLEQPEISFPNQMKSNDT